MNIDSNLDEGEIRCNEQFSLMAVVSVEKIVWHLLSNS